MGNDGVNIHWEAGDEGQDIMISLDRLHFSSWSSLIVSIWHLLRSCDPLPMSFHNQSTSGATGLTVEGLGLLWRKQKICPTVRRVSWGSFTIFSFCPFFVYFVCKAVRFAIAMSESLLSSNDIIDVILNVLPLTGGWSMAFSSNSDSREWVGKEPNSRDLRSTLSPKTRLSLSPSWSSLVGKHG